MTTNTMPKAEQIAFKPAGSITALDVQRAIEEIDGKASGAVGKYAPVFTSAASFQPVAFNVVNANAASNNVVVLNPNTADAGDLIVITKVDSSSNQVIFNAPINTGASSYVLTRQYQSVEFVYTGTAWAEVVRPIASQVVITDSGNYFTGSTVEEALTQLAQFGARSYTQEAYTATAGQFTFNLANSYTPGTNALQVFRNGLRLLIGTDYLESSSVQVSLLEAAQDGDLYVFNIGFVVNNGFVPTLSYLSETQVLTGGQTVVNLGTSYSVGVNNISVYLNGIRLVKDADYVETDSDTITLVEPAPAGAKAFFQIGNFVNDAVGVTSADIQHDSGLPGYPITNVRDALDVLTTVDLEILSKMTYYEPSYASAEALATTLPDDSKIVVSSDENSFGERVRYTVEGGLLTTPESDTAFMALTEDNVSVQEALNEIESNVGVLQGAAVYFSLTKAAGNALASTLPNGAKVLVDADESRFNERVRYTVASGALTGPVSLTAAQVLATGNVSVQSRLDTLLANVTYYAATKAAGNTLASTLPNGATVIVEADESRFGERVRYTVASAALGTPVPLTATQVLATGNVSVQSRLDTLLANVSYYVATKAAGNTLASSLPNGATVVVEADESRFGEKVRYTVASAALTTPIPLTAAQVLATGNVSVQTRLNAIQAEVDAVEVDVAKLKISVSAKTASFTPAVADNANYYRYNSASAGVATIPTNATQAFPLYTSLDFRQVGAGKLTLTPAGGVTINGVSGTVNATRAMGSTLSLVKVGTDEWDITGDLEQV